MLSFLLTFIISRWFNTQALTFILRSLSTSTVLFIFLQNISCFSFKSLYVKDIFPDVQELASSAVFSPLIMNCMFKVYYWCAIHCKVLLWKCDLTSKNMHRMSTLNSTWNSYRNKTWKTLSGIQSISLV